LNNDSDPDDDPLTVLSVVEPPNGVVEISPEGIVKYTPDEGFSGEEVFDYTISDGNGEEATATITVTVNTVTVPDEPTVEVRAGEKTPVEDEPPADEPTATQAPTDNIVPGLDQTPTKGTTAQGGGDPVSLTA